jgi:hypothetical protein
MRASLRAHLNSQSIGYGGQLKYPAMANLSDFEKLLPTFSHGEKAQILKWVVRSSVMHFPGSTLVPMYAAASHVSCGLGYRYGFMEQARRLGASEQALLAAYQSLRAEDLVNAWAYARSHAAEIEAQIRENETA